MNDVDIDYEAIVRFNVHLSKRLDAAPEHASLLAHVRETLTVGDPDRTITTVRDRVDRIAKDLQADRDYLHTTRDHLGRKLDPLYNFTTLHLPT